MFEEIKKRREKILAHYYEHVETEQNIDVPEGVYHACEGCGMLMHNDDYMRWLNVCSHCNHHHRMHCVDRIVSLFDSFEVFNHRMQSCDPLDFEGYQDKLDFLVETQGVYDAIVTGDAVLEGHNIIGIVFDPFFMMGSMGSVVGEKIARALERAIETHRDVVLITASGGARMQEGMVSLMQMAKVSMAYDEFSNAGGCLINVLTHPTTGGVTASIAMLGDLILAEPKSLICLAGPRVIEQTIHEALPEDALKAEDVLKSGYIDCVVHRHELKETISNFLMIHGEHLWK